MDQISLANSTVAPIDPLADDPVDARVGPVRPLMILVVLAVPTFAAVLAAGVPIGYVFEPAAVGILWAGVFLAGVVLGGLARGSGLAVALATGYLAVAHAAFQQLSGFSAGESLIVAAVVIVTGWITGRRAINNHSLFAASSTTEEREISQRGSFDALSLSGVLRLQSQPKPKTPRTFQIELWDITFAMSVSAVVLAGLKDVASPLPLIACGVAAMVGGFVCSALACRWAWHDHWSPWSFAVFVAGGVLCVGVLVANSPMPVLSTLKWLLSGPVSTIGAQATTVLFICATWRWEVRREGPS